MYYIIPGICLGIQKVYARCWVGVPGQHSALQSVVAAEPRKSKGLRCFQFIHARMLSKLQLVEVVLQGEAPVETLKPVKAVKGPSEGFTAIHRRGSSSSEESFGAKTSLESQVCPSQLVVWQCPSIFWCLLWGIVVEPQFSIQDWHDNRHAAFDF